jgi:hypothetical protein
MPSAPQTRLLDASAWAQLRRMPRADQQLILLLVSLGAETARERLTQLAEPRRTALAPRVEEILALDRVERHALFQQRPPAAQLPRPLSPMERPRLARLQRGEGQSTLHARDAAFGRSLGAMARRPRSP